MARRAPNTIACAVALAVTVPSGWSQEPNPQADQHGPEQTRPRASFGGPDQVDNLLQDDARPKKPLISLTFLKPYFDFEQRVKEKTGLSFALDYTTVYLGASEILEISSLLYMPPHNLRRTKLTIVNDHGTFLAVKEVSVSKFKATCLELLREVQETGQSILITKHGNPVAEVHPPRPKRARSPIGIMKGRGEILGDIVSPAVPAEEWDGLKK